jgi:hypothetical protein
LEQHSLHVLASAESVDAKVDAGAGSLPVLEIADFPWYSMPYFDRMRKFESTGCRRSRLSIPKASERARM